MKNNELSKEHLTKIVEISNKLFVNGHITKADIDVELFENGFISNVYKVAFNKSVPAEHQHQCERIEVPQTIVIKFYENENVPYDIYTAQLNSVVVSLASQHRLAPKVLYACKEAVVFKFNDCRDADHNDDQKVEFLRELAAKLAKFHSLEVPIAKNNTLDKFEDLRQWMLQNAADVENPNSELRKKLEAYGGRDLLEGNLRDQIEFVIDRVVKSNEPIVFSHCDFNHTNILMIKKEAEAEDVKEDICFIDFDFSGYDFRGRDIGKFFSNCDQDHLFSGAEVIGDEKMLQFIQFYIEENDKLTDNMYGRQSQNEVRKILKEAKLFVLFSYLIDITFCLWYTSLTGQDKHREFVQNANRRFAGLLRAKERFRKDNSV